MAEAGRIDVIINIDILGIDSFDRVASAASRMGTGVQQAGNQMQAQESKFERLRAGLSQLEQRYDGVFRAGFRLQATGRDLVNGGQQILGFLGQAVDAWGDYEFMLNRAAGALGLFDKQSELYKGLRNDLEAVAQEVRMFPADDIAKATYFWASTTGQQVESEQDLKLIMNQLIPIMKVAALTQTDYETAVKTAYNVTQQFNLGLDQSGPIIEKLMLIAQRTAAELGDLTESMKYVGPVAAQLHVPFDEVAKTLGILADEGIRGSQAGRALRQMFRQTLKPSAAAKAALDDLFKSTKGMGKSFQEIIFPKGEFIGMEGYVNALAIATKNMTTAERGHLLAQITTANEMPVLTALLDRQREALKTGKSAWDDAKYDLSEYGAQFENMFGLLKDSWKGVVGFLTNTWMAIVRRVGESVAKMVTPYVNMLGTVLQGVDTWMKANDQVVQMVVNIAGVIAVVLIAIGVFLSIVGSMILFVAGITVAVSALSLMISLFGGVILAIVAFGAVIGVVISHVAEHWDVFQAKVRQIGENFSIVLSRLSIDTSKYGGQITDAIGWVADQITGYFDRMINSIYLFSVWLKNVTANPEVITFLQDVGRALAILVGWVVGIKVLTAGLGGLLGMVTLLAGGAVMLGKLFYAFSGLKQVIGLVRTAITVGKGLVNLILNVGWALKVLAANPIVLIIAAIVAAIALLAYAWYTNFGGIQEKTKAVIDFIGKILGGLVDTFSRFAAPIIDIIQNKLPKVIDFLRDRFEDWSGQISKAIAVVWPVIKRIGDTIRDVFMNVIVPAIQRVIAAVGPLVESIINFLVPVWTMLVQAVSVAMAVVGRVVVAAIDIIVGVFSWFVSTVIPILEPFFSFLVTAFGIVFDTVSKIITAALEVITGIFNVFAALFSGDWGALWDGIVGIFKGVWDFIVGIFDGANKLLFEILKAGLGIIVNLITTIWNGIVGFLSGIIGKVLEIGGNIIKGLWQGITNFVGWLWTNFTGFVIKVIQFFIDLPGKATTEGGHLVTGFWTGISNLVGWLVIQVTGFIAKIWNFFLELPGKALKLGGDIVKGIWDGITGLAGWLWDKVTGFMQDIWDNVITFWDNKSPSKRMASLGENLLRGLAVGLEDQTGATVKTMADTMLSISKTAEATRLSTSWLSDIRPSEYSFDSNQSKRIEIAVDVSSSDGSVNADNAQTIADGIREGLMLDRLEHMVSVA